MSEKKKKKKAAAAAAANAEAKAPAATLSKKDAKIALETSKTALREFMTKNKLKEDSEPTGDVGKEYKALRVAVKAAKTALKEAKGSGGGASGRATTYEYPEGMTDPKEKKRYRAKMRAAAAKGEKGDAAPAKTEKSEKKAKAAPAAEAPAKKKKKKSSED